MISFLRRAIRVARCGLTVLFLAAAAAATAQVPIPVQEQIRLFNSMSPAQQQSLIRELQRSLPPAQRDAIVGLLQGGGDAQGNGLSLDADSEAALSEAFAGAGEEEEAVEEEPRLGPEDTIVIQFQPRADDPRALLRTPEEQEQVSAFLERLEEGNPYQLDVSGLLYLPGVPAIPLAGLNVEETTVRVQAEPALRPFTIIVTFLPLEPVGVAALEPFGYDLFERSRRRSFAADTDVPVPADYVLGPGDTINIQLFGSQNIEYFLPVNRDGTINFPEIGPVNVSGLTFAQIRDMVNQRVADQMIGVRASVTVGELRSIRVSLLGDVERPGSYTVSGLTTITNALYAGGGVKPIGSLRNIALRRGGATVATLDLYDLLLRGDTSGDVRLQAGDAIFVPPIGARVTVDGEVRRPAIYEVDDEETVAELIALAGGLNASANRTAVKLERVVPNRGTTVQDIDLAASGASPVRDGDVLRVPPNLDQIENSVRLAGNVFQPGLYQWRQGMRLVDLLPAPEVVRPKSDLNYVLIRRELAANIQIEALSADLQAAWRRPTSPDNLVLQSRDIVYVFHLETGRRQIVAPLIEELNAQADSNEALPVVRVGGQVRLPGEYPLEPAMRVSDLLRAGGGLSAAAYAMDAELTRYTVINGEYRETELVTVNLASVLRGDAAADLVVGPYDYLNIKEVSRWRGEESVTIRGEVVFPGTYPIRRGEKLSSLLARAGGLTELAFPEGSVFTRIELQEREREQLETLARRIERDLAAVSLADASAGATIATGQSLISQLRDTVATGRWAIRLDEIVAGNEAADVVLKGGDQLLVPDQRQEVTVLGEVQYATSHVYEPGRSRDDYISRSGGLSQRADKKRIYVVRANGEVVASSGGGWFQRDAGSDIRPGDAIVVPLDVGQPLARWATIAQIIYPMALAAAAVNSF
jgi:polysaccharide export outer membrane protein